MYYFLIYPNILGVQHLTLSLPLVFIALITICISFNVCDIFVKKLWSCNNTQVFFLYLVVCRKCSTCKCMYVRVCIMSK